MAPPPDTALETPASPLPAPAQTSDIFWCQNPCEDAFLFALDNAPYFLCETTRNTPAYTVNAGIAGAPSPDALFLLTTLTCYRAPVSAWLSNALARHYRFAQPLTMNIRTALHEAIANAVIHGNLGIHRRFQDRKGFDAYWAHIHTRLSHPEYRSARISVTVIRCPGSITLCVSDEGDGYEGNGSGRTGAFPLGRGLIIIREQCSAVRVTSGGSTIEMEFAV